MPGYPSPPSRNQEDKGKWRKGIHIVVQVKHKAITLVKDKHKTFTLVNGKQMHSRWLKVSTRHFTLVLVTPYIYSIRNNRASRSRSRLTGSQSALQRTRSTREAVRNNPTPEDKQTKEPNNILGAPPCVLHISINRTEYP